MPHRCTSSRLYQYAALLLPLVLRCSGLVPGVTMTAAPSQGSASRTGFLKNAAISLIGVGVVGAQSLEKAVAAEPLVETYWGNGCFWHVQHEMIKAETSILGRTTDELTSYAGYGGAKGSVDKGGKLCYHNMRGIGDYGKAGAGEVVSVMIPPSKIPEFSKAYFDMFVRYDNGAGRVFMDRRDTQDEESGWTLLLGVLVTSSGRENPFKDRGGEYRSLLGVPGGLSGPMAGPIKEEAARRGLTLQEGSGADPDTLMRNKVFVMDTAAFPFFKGEIYHQFHNDMTEDYGRKYNDLRTKYAGDGRMQETGCPERFL